MPKIDRILSLAALHVSLILLAGAIACSSDRVFEPEAPEEPRVLRLFAITPTLLSGFAGQPVSPMPTVRVLDLLGRPAAGEYIGFSATEIDGRVVFSSDDAPVVRTDESGVATIPWVLGSGLGFQALVVWLRSNGGAGVPGVQPIEFRAAAHLSDPPKLGASSHITFVRPTQAGRSFAPGAGWIFTLSAEGHVEQLTGGNDNYPVWSRDGSALAFVRYGPGAQAQLCILDGRSQGDPAYSDWPCASLSLRWVSGRPAWSPDGREIAFLGTVSGSDRTRLYAVQSGDLTTIRVIQDVTQPFTGTGGDYCSGAGDVSWSAATGRIAFVTCGRVAIVAPDGSALTLLPRLRAANYDVETVSWSPDGTRLAVGLQQTDCWDSCDAMIATVAADGSDYREIIGANWHLPRSPSWSPDGQSILYTRGDWRYPEVVIAPADPAEPGWEFVLTHGQSASWRP